MSPAADRPSAPPLWARLGPLALVLCAAAWIHWGALRAPFFSDDYLFVDQARSHSLAGALAARDPIGNFFRPVGRQVHFWVLVHAVGADPRAFHAVNLALFLGALVLLFGVARRVAGTRAAHVATAVVALHYAADVPVLWASGSQDLLAVVGALGALWLYLAGRRGWAALPYALALLSKETVAVLPLIAVVAELRPGASKRAAVGRAWPLLLVTVAWALVWVGTLARRPGAASDLSADPRGVAAALLHLAQVFLGLEWRAAAPLRPEAIAIFIPLAAVLAALWWAIPRAPGKRSAPSRRKPRSAPAGGSPHQAHAARHGLLVGGVWAGLAALPVAAAASIWSAYFYLFAVCGVALAFGALLARAPRTAVLAAVALLGLASENARRLDEFATARGPWTSQSHVNRFYLDRAMSRLARFLAEMRQARPSLPARSTLFFGEVPVYLGWQTGDGPLVRWAYRDTSLRSYYLSALSADKVARGPLFFFLVREDTLRDHTDDPYLFALAAFAQVKEDRPEAARAWLRLALQRDQGARFLWYVAGWTALATGDSAAARSALERAGLHAARGPSPDLPRVERALAARDTAAALGILDATVRQYALDPEVHERTAAILLASPNSGDVATIEAYATTVLSPRDPRVWRRWSDLQLADARYAPAYHSLEKYFELAGVAASADRKALAMRETIKRALPGGDLYQAALRK